MKKYLVAILLLVATSSTSFAECVQWQQFGNRTVCVERHGD